VRYTFVPRSSRRPFETIVIVHLASMNSFLISNSINQVAKYLESGPNRDGLINPYEMFAGKAVLETLASETERNLSSSPLPIARLGVITGAGRGRQLVTLMTTRVPMIKEMALGSEVVRTTLGRVLWTRRIC
jgi:hypothetical protein